MPDTSNTNSSAISDLGAAIQALIKETLSQSTGTNQSMEGTAQVTKQSTAVEPPTVGTADPTSVSQTSQGLVKTTNMKTGEFQSPYQEEQQQLLDQMEQSQTELKDDTALKANKAYIDSVYNRMQQPYEYDMENDPLLQKAKANIQQSVMDMANKRGFAIGGIDDIVNQQVLKLQPQFEQIAYDRNSDYLSRQIALANTMMKFEQQQFDRKKNQVEVVRAKLDFINRLDRRELDIFKTMLDQRNMQRDLYLQTRRLENEKKLNELNNALNRIEALGYTDEQSSIALGIPVGTKAKWVQQAVLEHQYKLETMAKEHEYALAKQKLDAEIEKELFAQQNYLSELSKIKYLAIEYQYKKDVQALEFSYAKQKASISAARARSYSSGGGGGSGGSSGSGYTDAQLNAKYTSESKAFIKKFGNKSSYGQDAAVYLDGLAKAGVPQEVLMRMRETFNIPSLKTKTAPLVSVNWDNGTVKVSGKEVKATTTNTAVRRTTGNVQY